MSSISAPTRDHDALELRVGWRDKFEGTERRYLAVDIYLNGESYGRSATSVWSLAHSTFEAGEFHFDTCTCGYAGCAGFWNGVFVRHERGTIVWYVPDHDGGPGHEGRPVRHRVLRFEYEAYRREVTACLRRLAKAKRRRKSDVLVTLNENPEDFKRLLDEVLSSPAPVDAKEGSAQNRLWSAIVKWDIDAAVCALVDGADLLQREDNGESPWDRAMTQYACGVAPPCFVTHLAHYLPTPIPEEANPNWLFDAVVEDGPAELLSQMTVPGGALPLNDARAQRARARLDDLRTMWQPADPSSTPDESVRWNDSLDRRRRLLETELKIEALERSINQLTRP